MAKNPILRYNTNWNGKLLNPIHTTLRLWLPAVYFKGAKFDETLNDVYMGTVIVVDIKRIKLNAINDWIAGLDTGYLADPCKEMIKTMYKAKVSDWDTQELAFMLLKKVDPA